MVNYNELIPLAKALGFTEAAPLDVSTLEFLQQVRDMCNPEQCPRYGKAWSCPPAAPSLEEMRGKAEKYSKGILVQTVGQLEDSYDWDGIQTAARGQSKSFERLWDALEPLYPALYPMGTGGCSKCEKCTYPDEPCRFPNRSAYSMEACGLFVSKVCTDNGVKYNNGPNTITYTGCFLLE